MYHRVHVRLSNRKVETSKQQHKYYITICYQISITIHMITHETTEE